MQGNKGPRIHVSYDDVRIMPDGFLAINVINNDDVDDEEMDYNIVTGDDNHSHGQEDGYESIMM